MSFFLRPLPLLLLCAVLAIAVAPFVFDFHFSADDYKILHNCKVRPFPIDTDFRGAEDGGYFRPLITFSFALNEWLSPGKPWSFHLFNLLIHAINSVFVVLLGIRLFKTRVYVAMLTGFVFFLLPHGVMNSYWIAGRTDLLCSAGVFAAAVAVIRFIDRGQWLYLFLMILSFAVALCSKETAVIFLLYLFLIALIYHNRGFEVSQRKRMISAALAAIGLLLLYLLYRLLLFSFMTGSDTAVIDEFSRVLMWLLHGIASLSAPVDLVDIHALWQLHHLSALAVGAAVVVYIAGFTLLLFRSPAPIKREVLYSAGIAFIALLLYLPTFPAMRLAYVMMPMIVLPAMRLSDIFRASVWVNRLIFLSVGCVIAFTNAGLIWKSNRVAQWNRETEAISLQLPDVDSLYVLAPISRIGQYPSETVMPIWQPPVKEQSSRKVIVLCRFEGSLFTDWENPFSIQVYGDTLELLSSDNVSGFIPVFEQKFADLQKSTIDGVTLLPMEFAPLRKGVLKRVRFYPVPMGKMVAGR